MKLIKFALLFICIQPLNMLTAHAQVNQDRAEIIATINNYIEGTSFNYPERVKAAFMPEANMFLDYKDNPLYIMKIEDYAERVGRSEPGVFNGRVTNILSIDQFAGIATAKLEVLIPSMERRFIDFLLLKKLENGWKIISKTAGSEESNRQNDKALIVVSSAFFHGDSEYPAGNSFSEVAIAFDEYKKGGYHVDFLSPKGGQVPLAYVNTSDELQRSYLYDADFMHALEYTKQPSEINPDEYQIIQFTGGSAPVFDIPENVAIQKIAMHIYEKNNGVIAAVCHGTAGIVNLKTADGDYLVDGKTVNGVPDSHENPERPQYEYFPFLIETVLKERGGEFKHSGRSESHMEVDGRLVTGQNSLSSAIVTRKTVEIVRSQSE